MPIPASQAVSVQAGAATSAGDEFCAKWLGSLAEVASEVLALPPKYPDVHWVGYVNREQVGCDTGGLDRETGRFAPGWPQIGVLAVSVDSPGSPPGRVLMGTAAGFKIYLGGPDALTPKTSRAVYAWMAQATSNLHP